MRVNLTICTTNEYLQEVDSNLILDCRSCRWKKDPSSFEKYIQVFDDKHGFINNLSVLDLLFNEGKFALDYMKKPKLVINTI
jgi:hypothetical protein